MRRILLRVPDDALVEAVNAWARRHGRSRNMEIVAALSEWVERSTRHARLSGPACSECRYWARYPDRAVRDSASQARLPFGRCECPGVKYAGTSQGGFFAACERFVPGEETWAKEEQKCDETR